MKSVFNGAPDCMNQGAVPSSRGTSGVLISGPGRVPVQVVVVVHHDAAMMHKQAGQVRVHPVVLNQQPARIIGQDEPLVWKALVPATRIVFPKIVMFLNTDGSGWKKNDSVLNAPLPSFIRTISLNAIVTSWKVLLYQSIAALQLMNLLLRMVSFVT